MKLTTKATTTILTFSFSFLFQSMTGESTELDDMDLIQVDEKVLRRLSGNSSGQDLNKALASFGVTILQNGFKDLVTNLLSYITDSRCVCDCECICFSFCLSVCLSHSGP